MRAVGTNSDQIKCLVWVEDSCYQSSGIASGKMVTKEIAQEIRTMADFIYERDKKLIKELEKKIDEEIKYNKIAHEAYDARFRKLEIEQVYFNNERKAS